MAEREFNLSMLDGRSLDDIADIAGFEVPVPGIYTLELSTKLKVINDADFIEVSFKTIECIQQNDDALAPTMAGTMFSTLTDVSSDQSLGYFKKLVAPVAAHFGENNLLTLVTETLAEPVIVTAKVKRRKDKEDPEKFYPDVSNLVVV